MITDEYDLDHGGDPIALALIGGPLDEGDVVIHYGEDDIEVRVYPPDAAEPSVVRTIDYEGMVDDDV